MVSRKRTAYYIDLYEGCTIIKATGMDIACRNALATFGTSSFRSIRRATDDDISWVTAMGGAIHEI